MGEKRKITRRDHERPACGTPDNRKPVLRLHQETYAVLGRHDSQNDAADFVRGNSSTLSQSIRNGNVYMGFRWKRECGNDSGQGSSSPAGGSAARNPHPTEGRCPIVAIDFGHAGTGFAIDYKGTGGLLLFGTSLECLCFFKTWHT